MFCSRRNIVVAVGLTFLFGKSYIPPAPLPALTARHEDTLQDTPKRSNMKRISGLDAQSSYLKQVSGEFQQGDFQSLEDVSMP